MELVGSALDAVDVIYIRIYFKKPVHGLHNLIHIKYRHNCKIVAFLLYQSKVVHMLMQHNCDNAAQFTERLHSITQPARELHTQITT